MEAKKVFFFDVDGTLLPHGNETGVHKETVYALNELKSAGHDVVLCTGKSEKMIKDEIAAIKASNHITMNGAHIVIDNQVAHIDTVSREVIDELKEIANRENLMLGCQMRDDYYIVDINYDEGKAIEVLNKVSLDLPRVESDFAINHQISQLWFLGDYSNLDVNEHIVPGFRLLPWHDEGIDIVIDGVNKATAIDRYLNMLYPNTDVITYTFGDGNNDVEMIEYANVGVAMGNAVDKLKNCADIVIDTCENLGVYNYLVNEQLIGEME